jgi:chemotaxis protein methyltransferase CheR
MEKLTIEEHETVSKYIYDITGISIGHEKAYLIEARLGKLINELGLSSYIDLCEKSRMDLSKTIEKKIINSITTNETLFFRDILPFELMKNKIVPELIDKRSFNAGSQPTTIKIWSAACSTGQEVFSIAITLQKILFNLSKYNITLLGSDISEAAISQASEGIYNKFEIERGLTNSDISRYFKLEGNNWRIKDEIRQMAIFKKQNLMSPFDFHSKFDVIFCRNVAIYFKIDDRKNLFNKIAQFIEPDGYLIIGATESLTGICPLFEPKRHLGSIFYQLKHTN